MKVGYACINETGEPIIPDLDNPIEFLALCATATELLGDVVKEAQEPVSNQHFVLAWGPCDDPDCQARFPHVARWLTSSYPVTETFLVALNQRIKNVTLTQRDRCVFFTFKGH